MSYSKEAIKKFYGDNKYVGTKEQSTRTEPVFHLKISEEEKYEDDCQWFKDYAEYIVPSYSTVIDNYKEMKLSYDVYNDNLDGYKEKLDKFCNQLGENIGQIEEEIIAYPKLHNKVNVLKGELLKRNDVHKVVMLSAKAIKAKNEQLVEKIKESVEEDVQLAITQVQQQMKGMSEDETNKYIESLRTQKTPEDIMNKNFQSEWEIFYNKGLKYAQFDQDLKTKKMETLEDTIIADRCFIYSGWRHGKPYLEVRNPLYCSFQKAPNELYVHKGDYFAYKKPITLASVYNTYGHLLSQEQIEELGIHTYNRNYRIDKRHALGPHKKQFVFDTINEEIFRDIFNYQNASFEDKTTGTHQGQGIDRRYSRETLVWETHIEFMAYRELIFLSYVDDYNERITIPLSKDFEIPKNAEKIEFTNRFGHDTEKFTWVDELSGVEYEAERLWIPWRYEVIRLGENIYPICRAVPYQNVNVENPYSSFSLSTFGAIFTSRNAKSISLLQRAIPAYFQYLYIKHVQTKELAKYQGFIQDVDLDQVPLKLGEDQDGNLIRDPVAVWLLYRKQLGLNLYSGSQSSQGALPPATRSPGSGAHIVGTAGDIFNLQQLLEYIDREIGMAMGISPQREAQFSEGSNVTDNRQAIAQSHHITESYFYLLSQVWKEALTDYLQNFRTYCQMQYEKTGETPLFHYVLPDGTEELFEVTPKMLEMQDIGLYVSNSGQDQQYHEIMLQLSHAFAQNAGEGLEAVSAIIKAITSGTSPEETHKLIQIESKKQQDRMQQMEQTKLKVQEEYAARQRELSEDNQAHEVQLHEMDNQAKKEVALINAYRYQQDMDKDKDGIPDPVEVMKLGKDAEIKERELDIKEKELQQQSRIDQEKLQVEREKIKAQKSKSKD